LKDAKKVGKSLGVHGSSVLTVKQTALHYKSQQVSVMTAAESHKKCLDTIMVSHCQGDNTSVALQLLSPFKRLCLNEKLFSVKIQEH